MGAVARLSPRLLASELVFDYGELGSRGGVPIPGPAGLFPAAALIGGLLTLTTLALGCPRQPRGSRCNLLPAARAQLQLRADRYRADLGTSDVPAVSLGHRDDRATRSSAGTRDSGAVLGRIAVACAGLATLVLGVLTYRRNQVYRSEQILWTDTVQRRPENARAWTSLAGLLREAGAVAGGLCRV